MKILVVDDDLDLLQLIAFALRRRGQAPFSIWRRLKQSAIARSVSRSSCFECAKKWEGRSRFLPARTLIAKPPSSAITASTRSVAMPLRWNVSESSAAPIPSLGAAVPQPYETVRLPVL